MLALAAKEKGLWNNKTIIFKYESKIKQERSQNNILKF